MFWANHEMSVSCVPSLPCSYECPWTPGGSSGKAFTFLVKSQPWLGLPLTCAFCFECGYNAPSGGSHLVTVGWQEWGKGQKTWQYWAREIQGQRLPTSRHFVEKSKTNKQTKNKNQNTCWSNLKLVYLNLMTIQNWLNPSRIFLFFYNIYFILF